ncbi:MAG TPA: hypothetical protein VGM98_22275 [Schlesneria sp.]
MWTRFVCWALTILGRDPRGLFCFHDGRRWRHVDPLVVARGFWTHPSFDWDETPKLLQSGNSSIQLQAFQSIAVAVRDVFSVRELSEGGLSEQECLDLLSSFRQYLGDVKKNGSLFPISVEPTASPPWDDLPIPRRPGSASGSTVIEPSPEPLGSPAEPTSPA